MVLHRGHEVQCGCWGVRLRDNICQVNLYIILLNGGFFIRGL